MSQNPSSKTKKYGGGGNNCKEDNNDYSQDRYEWHQGKYEEEVEEEYEEVVITCLRQDLKSFRNQTRVVFELIWNEVERPGQRPRTGKHQKGKGRLQRPRQREMPRTRRGRDSGLRKMQNISLRSPGSLLMMGGGPIPRP